MAYTAPTQRNTGDLITSTIYNTDLVDNIDFLGTLHDHSGDTGDGGNLTRGMFIPPTGTTGGTLAVIVDGYVGCTLRDAQSDLVNFVFRIPANFQAVDKLVVVSNPQQSNNIVRTGTINYGADGQSNVTHSDTISQATVILVDNQLDEDNIAGDFSAEAALDIVGVEYQRLGSNGSDTYTATLQIIGLYFEWH